MRIGDYAEVTRAFSRQDLQDYASLGILTAQAERVPEPLVGALFSYLLGVKLPGAGTMYLKQETRYRKNALIGEPLTARVEITRLRPKKQLADLSTSCFAANGDRIASGRALVYVGDVATEREPHE